MDYLSCFGTYFFFLSLHRTGKPSQIQYAVLYINLCQNVATHLNSLHFYVVSTLVVI